MAINVKIFKEGFLRLLPLILLIYMCISEFHTQFYYWKIFSFNIQFIIIYYWILRDPSILGYGFVFLCGIINDVVLSLPLGTSALSYLFVSLVAAYVRNATVRSTLFTDWFTFVVAILGGNMLTYFLIKNFIVGKTFSIREVSVIEPSFIGTLKSTLNKTLFPSIF